MNKDTFRQASRKEWSPADDKPIGRDAIGVGCLQRIADATERMANVNFVQLANERDRYKAQCTMLRRQLGAARGVITQLRKQIPGD